MSTSTTSPVTAEQEPSYYRRNFWAFACDIGMFYLAMSFVSASTVIPSLFAELTHSEIVIGLATGLINVAWLLPQLLVASWTARLSRVHRFFTTFAFISRPLWFFMAGVIALLGTSRPTLTLVLVTGLIFVFYVLDAFVSVPWFDLLGIGLPERRRGRVQGMAQIIGGVAGIFAGALVRYILSDDCRIGFPGNYALLFTIAAVVLMVGAVAIALIHEPRGKQRQSGHTSARAILRQLPGLVHRDSRFLRLITLRIIAGAVVLANAFYVLYGLRELGFARADTGLFVSAQIAGSLAAGLLIGLVQDRWGPVALMRVNIGLSIIPPALALLAAPVQALVGGDVLYLYLLLYFALGLFSTNIGWAYFNWILEYAPEERRALYIGTINTAAAALMLAPTIGGLIVRLISYQAAFIAAMVIAACVWSGVATMTASTSSLSSSSR